MTRTNSICSRPPLPAELIRLPAWLPIFDGSQAGALMQSVGSGGLDSIELVRVTVYDLPHSHAVWVGWCAMMGGMALVTVSGMQKETKPSTSVPFRTIEEE